MASDNDRPQRQCDVCGQVDDHPRHRVVFGAQDNPPPVDQDLIETVIANNSLSARDRSIIIRSINDPTDQLRHIDCCAQVGCPDGSCDAIRRTGAEKLRGPKLLAHLTSGKVNDLTSGASASQEG